MSDFQNEDATITYYSDTEILYSSEVSLVNAVEKQYLKTASEFSSPINSRSYYLSDGTIAYWGTNNLYPQEIYKKASKNPVITATIQDKTDIASSGKIYYGIRFFEKGKERFERVFHPEIENFILNNQLQTRFLNKAYSNLYWYYNVFPELILNSTKSDVYFSGSGKMDTLPSSKILGVNILDAQNCRWSLQNKKGRIPFCYVNAQWEYEFSHSENTIKIPVIDHYFDAVSWLKKTVETSSRRKFIYPISYYSSGKTFYQMPVWTSVLNGWLDVALSIPVFKKAMMENVMTIKYHVKVADWYWSQKYHDWTQKPQLQKERRQDELEIFNRILSGAKNAGRSLMTEFKEINGKEYQGWYIELIDGNKNFADGIYLDDGEAANLQLLYALNFPSALSGNSLSKSGGNSAGGSEVQKRFNTYLTKCSLHGRIFFELLNFIARYNQWTYQGKMIEFLQEKPFIQDLSETTPSKRESIIPPKN